MRILLLEDEESIRGFIRINLKRNGMDVTEAEEGETALALAEEASPPFDVALLDVMLPTISGFDVCGRLRERFPRMGIIMLTAKSQEEDKIRGLELGADDYVQKPFSPGELIARLNALHRRMMPGGLSQTEPASPDSAAKDPAAGGAAAHGAAGNDAGSRGTGSAGGGGVAEGGSGAGTDGARLSGANAGHEPPAGTLNNADGGGTDGRAGTVSMNGGGADRRAGTGSSDGSRADGGAGASAPDGGATGFYSDAGRSQAAPGEKRCGPFRLLAAERRLWKVDEEIVLTPTEWTLVKLLMERAGEGLSRDEILNAVWGRHFIGDLKIVDVNIRRIRQKIEDEPSDPRYIETLWGYGYRWNRSDKR